MRITPTDDDEAIIQLCVSGCTPADAKKVLRTINTMLAIEPTMYDAVMATFWMANEALLNPNTPESVADAYLVLHEWITYRYLAAANGPLLTAEVEHYLGKQQ